MLSKRAQGCPCLKNMVKISLSLSLSLSLSPEFDDEMVHMSWTLLETAWKDEKSEKKK
jgi:hypothetical protein